MRPTSKASRTIILSGLLLFACTESVTAPEAPGLLSDIQTSFKEDTQIFYVAALVTLPDDVIALDSIWLKMYMASGELADSVGTDTVMAKFELMDDGTGGDILSTDGLYARSFASPLPLGTGGSVRIEIYATIVNDTSQVTDTLNLVNLPPVILSVDANDSLTVPVSGAGSVAIDTIFVEVADPDGLEDITVVGFYSLKPDSSWAYGGDIITLSDNGPVGSTGDLTADDGIFTRIIFMTDSAATGNYIYKIIAKDLAGNVSDTTEHVAVVQ